MACIICFLDDEYQEKLRNISQSKGERFEHSLNEYKKIFFAELNSLNSIRKCSSHKSLNYQTIVWATRLHQTIIRIADKQDFFESIINSYIEWISGNITKSINSLEKLLVSKKRFFETESNDTKIFFRGRKSTNHLQKEDLFHIPFNKRYLISNQRYSLTGQPLLYFGLSILDVLAELRVSINNFEDVYFSSFVDIDNSFNIYKFANPFQGEISSIDIIMNQTGSVLDYNDRVFGNNSKKHKNDFYKYILLCISSFKRSFKNSNFIEEYVIPQILTEIVRKQKFDGILFPSTRINKSKAYSTEIFHVSKYKENIALFTNYRKVDNYDLELLNKFLISKPIRLNDYDEISFSEIEKLGKQIIQLNNKKGRFRSLRLISEITGISYKIHFEKLKIKDENGDFVNYFDHKIGKLHNYIIYTQLLTIRNDLL